MTVIWRVLPPGSPLNLSVTVWYTEAVVRWKHALPQDGGLATHYAAKWQTKDALDVVWYPDWLGVGGETMKLEGLTPGASYAVRIAAINKQGRAWSDIAAFTMLKHLQCQGHWHWSQLLSTDEVQSLCGSVVDDTSDPDPRACSVGSLEYVLAGGAAGAVMSFVAVAILVRMICFQRGWTNMEGAQQPRVRCISQTRRRGVGNSHQDTESNDRHFNASLELQRLRARPADDENVESSFQQLEVLTRRQSSSQSCGGKATAETCDR